VKVCCPLSVNVLGNLVGVCYIYVCVCSSVHMYACTCMHDYVSGVCAELCLNEMFTLMSASGLNELVSL